MDDLISRAAALDAISTDGGCGMCARRILDVPAVDAIPVEWIENMLQHWLKGSATLEMCLGITEMLHIWQKEQEAQDVRTQAAHD